jgi:predicted O-methyltransferase YrrM
MSAASTSVRAPLLLTVPILERMRRIDGWLHDAEADLLIAGLTRALADARDADAVVEVGSYCGRATVVLGSVVRAVRRDARVHAIDPHDGVVGALDEGIRRTAPTLSRFRRAIAGAGLDDVVVTVQRRAHEVAWDAPIAFLLVDGLHDYASVSRDYGHFEPWLAGGALVAFHDYADYFPGVVAFVDELLAAGRATGLRRAETMMLVRPAS